MSREGSTEVTHRPKVTRKSGHTEEGECTYDRVADWPQSLTDSSNEEDGGHPNKYRRFDSQENESPIPEHGNSPLTVSIAVVPWQCRSQGVNVQALFRRHREECGEQGEQGTLVVEYNIHGRLGGDRFLDRWNDNGFTWGGGVEIGCSLTDRVGFGL